MYYVPDGTERCGYYECSNCDLKIGPAIITGYNGCRQFIETAGHNEKMQTRHHLSDLHFLWKTEYCKCFFH